MCFAPREYLLLLLVLFIVLQVVDDDASYWDEVTVLEAAGELLSQTFCAGQAGCSVPSAVLLALCATCSYIPV